MFVNFVAFSPQPMPYQQPMQPHHQPVPQPGQMQQPGMMPQQQAPQPWGAPYQNPYGQMAPVQAPGVPDPGVILIKHTCGILVDMIVLTIVDDV